MICLYKERDIFKNGFTNVLNFAFTNVVYLVRKLNVVRHSKTEPNKMKVREEKLRTIIEWSEKNEDVRVLLLTSSLVNPLALVDEFSDLDIEFVFEDNTNYISDKSWTLKFGNPIAMIEEDESCFNHKHAMKMLLYEDGVKVDFKLYSKSKFIKETQEKELPEDWDIGYKILIDKDGITKQMHYCPKKLPHRFS